MVMAALAVVKLMKKTLAALKHERALIDAAIKALLHDHATPAIRSGKGMGPVFQATTLALLPVLRSVGRQFDAKCPSDLDNRVEARLRTRCKSFV